MTLQENLYKLYLLDKQVRGLQSRLDSSTRRLTAQTAKLDQLHQQREELQTLLKQTKAKATSLESQSQDSEQRIEKLRQQMQTVTNNKEYSAVLLEVNTLKEEKSKLEDEALEQLSEVDRFNGELDELATQLTEKRKIGC